MKIIPVFPSIRQISNHTTQHEHIVVVLVIGNKLIIIILLFTQAFLAEAEGHIIPCVGESSPPVVMLLFRSVTPVTAQPFVGKW